MGRNHAQERAKEHYGLNMSLNDLIILRKAIEAGEYPLFRKIGKNGGIYKVLFKGKRLLAMYCGQLRKIKTFLKPAYMKNQTIAGKQKLGKTARNKAQAYRRTSKYDKDYLDY